jgi:signal transduction histidine kinase
VIAGLLVQRRLRQRTEITLRDLSGRLLSAQEDERRRIARELHDNVSQQMALLSIEITQVTKGLGETAEPLARSIRELGQRAGAISTEIHNLSHRLHSSRLEALGLAEAVRGHCDELCAQGIHASFHDENIPRSLPHSVELCLFRIVQEGLNNVVKHSGAREAQVALRAKGEVIQLTIADFGHGFDERSAKVRSGLGLASMRERLRLIHGEFDVHSEPGQGTTIIARVPIRDVGGPTSDEGVCVA